MIFFLHNSATVIFHRQIVNNHQTGNCCRECNEEILLKFICHFTTLSIACGNCRIRYERQIISKHCTSHYCSNTKWCRKSRSSGYRYSNGNDQCDRSNGCSHGQRDKAAHNKQNNHCKLRWNQRQYKICHTVGRGSSDYSHKNSCQHKYNDHCNNIRVTDSLAHYF